jgi:hypothetical protein
MVSPAEWARLYQSTIEKRPPLSSLSFDDKVKFLYSQLQSYKDHTPEDLWDYFFDFKPLPIKKPCPNCNESLKLSRELSSLE